MPDLESLSIGELGRSSDADIFVGNAFILSKSTFIGVRHNLVCEFVVGRFS